MGTRTLFTVTAALMLFFGFGFILLPRLVFSIYGVALDPGGVMLARVAGAAWMTSTMQFRLLGR